MGVRVSRRLVHLAVLVLLASASASTVGLATAEPAWTPTDGGNPADAANASAGPDGNPHGTDRPSSHDPAEAVTHSHGAGDPPGPAPAASVGNDTDDERNGSEDEAESDLEDDESPDADAGDSDGSDEGDDDDAGAGQDDPDAEQGTDDGPEDPRHVERSDGENR